MKKLVKEALNEDFKSSYQGIDKEPFQRALITLDEIKEYCELAKTDAEETLEHYAGDTDDADIIAERAALERTISISEDILAIIK
jgi:hypothetical protein